MLGYTSLISVVILQWYKLSLINGFFHDMMS